MTTEQRRSEIVRSRRGQRRNTTSSVRTSRSSVKREMPPMVSRTGMVSTSVPQTQRNRKSQPNGRRRVDVPIRAGSAEIRLPSVAVPRVGWRAVSFILVAVLGFALFWMLTSPVYSATDDRIMVDGLNRVDRDILLAKSGILNRPLFLISPEEISESLPNAVTALDSVKVSVGLNGKVKITAVERVPVLTWDQEGIPQPSWVDVQGRLFPAMGSSENLVYVYANDFPPVSPHLLVANRDQEQPDDQADEEELDAEKGREPLLDPALVPYLLTLARSLPEGSRLVYDQDRGFGWEDPTYHWMVYFGKQLDQPDLRIKIYQAIVKMFEEKQNKPALISIEYLNAPYYRMEP